MKSLMESSEALPDVEKQRQELIKRHLEATKKLDKESLQRVYEKDYAKLFIKEPVKTTTEPLPRLSNKRSFMSMPGRKMYRRFCLCLLNERMDGWDGWRMNGWEDGWMNR